MATGEPFAVAGLYREWEEENGKKLFSFTQLTINADEHPFMRRFHRQGEETRSLVIVPNANYDDWLGCKDPERARTHLQPYPAGLMAGEPVPKVAVVKQHKLFRAGGGKPKRRSPASKRFKRRDKVSGHHTRCMNRTSPTSSTS